MTVVKVRGVDHSTDLREYRITSEGIEVRPKAPHLNGIMLGRPTLER
jgi:circadian clock protein KaiC